MGIFRQLQGSAVIASHLRERAVPYWERKKIEARRDRRVSRIVRYAVRNVPYYRDLFSERGWDARDVRTVEDLRCLPLLDRKQVRQEPKRFLAENAGVTLVQRTSGSTGTPMEVLHDRNSILANMAYGEREREVILRLVGEGFRPRELYVGFNGSNFLKVLEFTAAQARLPVRPRRQAMAMTDPFPDIIATINEYKPHILTTYGTFADEMFRRIQSEGLRIALPRVLIYVGETLPTSRRLAIEDEFGLAVLSRYCAVEAFKIAFYCEERTGFHIHDDLCDLQIRRHDGSVAEADETGEIVLSNLVNRATVLLNYPMGDLGTFRSAPCPCRRNLRLLSQIEGRLEDMIPLPDGRVLHPRAIWAAFKDDKDVLQYQLTQADLGSFSLRLVTAGQERFAAAASRARSKLDSILGAECTVDVNFESELGRLERTERGKFRAVRSRVDLPRTVA